MSNFMKKKKVMLPILVSRKANQLDKIYLCSNIIIFCHAILIQAFFNLVSDIHSYNHKK